VPTIGRRSFQLDHAIFFKGADTLVADGRSIVVWVDRASGQSVELSEELLQALELFTVPQQDGV